MKTNKSNFLGFWLAALTLVLSFSHFAPVQARSSSAFAERAYKIAADAVSNKLQNDLVTSDVRVKFAKVSQYSASDSQIGVKGVGAFSLDAKVEHQIDFDVKINQSDFKIINVEYNFAKAAFAENAMAAMEETVTQKLLKQFSADFKTSNIVIALDELTPIENRLEGTGEVRIGDFEWSKVKFEVVLNGKGAIETVKYQIQD